jgi:hypothetical protein
MSNYVATFFSHYDALTFFNYLKETGVSASLAPVPRKVSSSCGTCVAFQADGVPEVPDWEIEAIYLEENGKFVLQGGM